VEESEREGENGTTDTMDTMDTTDTTDTKGIPASMTGGTSLAAPTRLDASR